MGCFNSNFEKKDKTQATFSFSLARGNKFMILCNSQRLLTLDCLVFCEKAPHKNGASLQDGEGR